MVTYIESAARYVFMSLCLYVGMVTYIESAGQ